MNYLLIALIVLVSAIALILLAVYRTRGDRNARITAAKDRAAEISTRNKPDVVDSHYHPEPVASGVNVIVTDGLTEEQTRILSKIFDDDSLYARPEDTHWKPTEPSPLTKE